MFSFTSQMPRKKQYNKEEVTQKAMKTFWDNGYKATSMRMLEKDMGINLYSIYADFNSKEDLFLATLKEYKTFNKTVMLSRLIKSDGTLKDVSAFLQDFVQTVKSGKNPNGCLFANTAMELGGSDPLVAKELKLFFEFLKEVFTNLLTKSKAKGAIKSDANIDKYANYLIGITEGVALVSKVLDQDQIDDYIDTAMTAIV